MKPLNDRILVVPLPDENKKSASGLYMPETAKRDTPRLGEVMAVGPGKLDHGVRVPLQVEVGDRVLYGRYSGVLVQTDEHGILTVMREDEVYAVL